MTKFRNLIIFIFVTAVITSAVTITVPDQFKSIYKALLKAQPKDTVFVKNGIYYENISLVSEVVLIGEDQKKTIIDGRRKGPVVLGANDAVLEGFTIRNGTFGILCEAKTPLIKRNIIIDNKGSGINAIMGLPQIENNIIMRNKWNGIFLQSVKALESQIENNVIIENGYSGIHCDNLTQVTIRNNIIAGNSEYGVYCDRTAKRTRIIYNNFFVNMLGSTSYSAVENKTNIKKLPMFKNPSASISTFSYYCKAVSPMLKAGENDLDIGLRESDAVTTTGTSDKDNDGIPDDVDNCPMEPEDIDDYDDGDGCPDYDNDGDGIFDTRDQCPVKAEDKDGYEDEDGCPETDNDGDGILDVYDGAPNDPETFNGYKDEDGVPDELPKKISKKIVLRGINFRTGSADIMENSYGELDKVFNSLEAFPKIRIYIEGHTDSRGSATANKILSKERATSVRSYLISKGISPKRIRAIGYGESRPVASNKTSSGRDKNRRIEIKRAK